MNARTTQPYEGLVRDRLARLFAKARTQQLTSARQGDLRTSWRWATRARRLQRFGARIGDNALT